MKIQKEEKNVVKIQKEEKNVVKRKKKKKEKRKNLFIRFFIYLFFFALHFLFFCCCVECRRVFFFPRVSLPFSFLETKARASLASRQEGGELLHDGLVVLQTQSGRDAERKRRRAEEMQSGRKGEHEV